MRRWCAAARCQHFARLRIERGYQRERPVSVVLELVSLGATGQQGQHGMDSVEGLDGGFLIHREDGRMVGRIDMQTDHVRSFRFVGIVRLYVARESMPQQPRPQPGFRDRDYDESSAVD
jgi:hypothetical protein